MQDVKELIGILMRVVDQEEITRLRFSTLTSRRTANCWTR